MSLPRSGSGKNRLTSGFGHLIGSMLLLTHQRDLGSIQASVTTMALVHTVSNSPLGPPRDRPSPSSTTIAFRLRAVKRQSSQCRHRENAAT
jgi:hypothetical protein